MLNTAIVNLAIEVAKLAMEAILIIVLVVSMVKPYKIIDVFVIKIVMNAMEQLIQIALNVKLKSIYLLECV
jgi:hypothetical protein